MNVLKRIRYEITYLQMERLVKKALKDKQFKQFYIKFISGNDSVRGIGKSVALARLSAKHGIPIVTTKARENDYLLGITRELPQYFKKGLPTTIVYNENVFRGRYIPYVLVDECPTGMFSKILANLPADTKFIGYHYK